MRTARLRHSLLLPAGGEAHYLAGDLFAFCSPDRQVSSCMSLHKQTKKISIPAVRHLFAVFSASTRRCLIGERGDNCSGGLNAAFAAPCGNQRRPFMRRLALCPWRQALTEAPAAAECIHVDLLELPGLKYGIDSPASAQVARINQPKAIFSLVWSHRRS